MRFKRDDAFTRPGQGAALRSREMGVSARRAAYEKGKVYPSALLRAMV